MSAEGSGSGFGNGMTGRMGSTGAEGGQYTGVAKPSKIKGAYQTNDFSAGGTQNPGTVAANGPRTMNSLPNPTAAKDDLSSLYKDAAKDALLGKGGMPTSAVESEINTATDEISEGQSEAQRQANEQAAALGFSNSGSLNDVSTRLQSDASGKKANAAQSIRSANDKLGFDAKQAQMGREGQKDLAQMQIDANNDSVLSDYQKTLQSAAKAAASAGQVAPNANVNKASFQVIGGGAGARIPGGAGAGAGGNVGGGAGNPGVPAQYGPPKPRNGLGSLTTPGASLI